MEVRRIGCTCITFGLAVLFLITTLHSQHLKGGDDMPLPLTEKCEGEYCSQLLHQGETDSFSFWMIPS